MTVQQQQQQQNFVNLPITDSVHAFKIGGTIHLRLHGEVKTLKQWSQVTGIKVGTLYKRVTKLDWDVSHTIQQAVRDNRTFYRAPVIPTVPTVPTLSIIRS